MKKTEVDKLVNDLEKGIKPTFEFDQTKQYGDYLRQTDGSDESFELSESYLIPQMEKFISKEFRHLVVWIKHHWEEQTIKVKDENYEMYGLTKEKIGTIFVIPEHWTIGWKYTPEAKSRLDCEKKDCIHYGGLGCHGCDDPMNQTCCRLELNEATKCLNSPDYPKYITAEQRGNGEIVKGGDAQCQDLITLTHT